MPAASIFPISAFQTLFLLFYSLGLRCQIVEVRAAVSLCSMSTLSYVASFASTKVQVVAGSVSDALQAEQRFKKEKYGVNNVALHSLSQTWLDEQRGTSCVFK